ncbi:2869_t:CDS:1, partial [Racocetra persica]
LNFGNKNYNCKVDEAIIKLTENAKRFRRHWWLQTKKNGLSLDKTGNIFQEEINKDNLGIGSYKRDKVKTVWKSLIENEEALTILKKFQ